MNDQLEFYRRMVRTMRFLPPLAKDQPTHHFLPPSTTSSFPLNSWADLIRQNNDEIIPHSLPNPDPSAHIEALISHAVNQPTILPTNYTFAENIGDRISHLAPSKLVIPAVIPAPLPQVDVHEQCSVTLPSEDIKTDLMDSVITEEINTSSVILVEEISTEVTEIIEQISDVTPTELSVTVSTISEPISAQVSEDDQLLSDTEIIDVETAIAAPTEAAPILPEITVDVAVELTPSLEEQTLKVKASKIVCPKCKSIHSRKNGHYKGKQRYVCKDCGKQFIMDDVLEIKTKQISASHPITKSEEVTLVESEEVTLVESEEVTLVESEEVTLVKSEEVTLVKSEEVTLVESEEVTLPKSDNVTLPKSDKGGFDSKVKSSKPTSKTKKKSKGFGKK